VDHEGEAADVAEVAGGVQQPRLDVELVEDLDEVVVRHLLGGLPSAARIMASMTLTPTTRSNSLG
jgi:hypothetical protein